MKSVSTDYNKASLKHAKNLEDVLCLATLIASGILPESSDLSNSRDYFESEEVYQLCVNCPVHKKCLACIINE